MAVPGVSAEVGLLVFPSDKFTSPGLIETPQVGYLVVFVKSLKSCPTICDHVDCSTTGFPVLHYLLMFALTHIH